MTKMKLSLREPGDVDVTLWDEEGTLRVLHIQSFGDWDEQHVNYTWLTGPKLNELVTALKSRKDWKGVFNDGPFEIKQHQSGSCSFHLMDEFEDFTHELKLSAEEVATFINFVEGKRA